jgi:phosphoribosylformylglycinamidine synthase subunit PurL
MAGRVGCEVALPGDPFTMLFSESAARALVAVRPGAEQRFAGLCEQAGVPATVIGVTGGHALQITGLMEVPLLELTDAHKAALPALFGA